MHITAAFLRLIRWQNLLFIALTQILFYFCIVTPSLPSSYFEYSKSLSVSLLGWLVFASVLIAAAGYIINDYFDVNIDQVNKPDKMVVQRVISRRWAIFFHLFFTIVGLMISFYISYKTHKIIFLANVICALLLWFYSTTFKKKLLSGNIIISALTAWTIIVVYVAVNTSDVFSIQRIFKFMILYAGFAFIISLVREAVKDMEDMVGDAKYNCRTMPIAWGIRASKVYVGVWLVVLIGALLVVQIYALMLGWWLSSIYSVFFIIVPLIIIVRKLFAAIEIKEYHSLSTYVKLIMLSGILSMIFIRIAIT